MVSKELIVSRIDSVWKKAKSLNKALTLYAIITCAKRESSKSSEEVTVKAKEVYELFNDWPVPDIVLTLSSTLAVLIDEHTDKGSCF